MYNDYFLQEISSKLDDTNSYLDTIIHQNNNNNDLLVSAIDRSSYSNNIFLGTCILFLSIIMLYKFLPRKEYRKSWEVKFK